MAATDFFIKQHDTAPSITETLSSTTGAINLTGASVKFHLRKPDGTVAVNAAATIVTAASGIVRYQWVTGDTAVAGTHLREWEITFGDGTIETVPNDSIGYTVQITAEIA